MEAPHPKRLVAEGKGERGAIPALMRAHGVEWPREETGWPVRIHDYEGVTEILRERAIRNLLAEEGVETLGIVIDANDKFDGRWQRLRDECVGVFPDLPQDFPKKGLVETNADGKRLGIWIMPDNRSRGMLETLLGLLVSDEQTEVWEHAEQATAQAKKRGAPYKDVHADKAKIYTYLAWQDEPGMLFGTAIAAKCLDPHSEHGIPFVTWFKTLYELDG